MSSDQPVINIIVAVDRYGGFGKDGKIPWHFPNDLQRFKTLTGGAACIMGRRTYTDMVDMVKTRKTNIEELLPGRQSIVITSDPDLELLGGAVPATSLREGISIVELGRPIFVIGGEKLYIEALSFCSTIHMSIIKDEDSTYQCDKFFPVDYVHDRFKITECNEDDNLYYVKYERKT